jgi:hypothetical protein
MEGQAEHHGFTGAGRAILCACKTCQNCGLNDKMWNEESSNNIPGGFSLKMGLAIRVKVTGKMTHKHAAHMQQKLAALKLFD